MQSTWTEKSQFGPVFKFLISLFLIAVVFIGGLTIWVNWSLAAPSKNSDKKTFVIQNGESVSSFSNRLEEEKLIRNAIMFHLYLKLNNLDRKIQAGSFSLAENLTVRELSKALTEGRLDKLVTFVEGLRKEQVAEILSDNFNINKEKFIADSPEGYLFPDTYLIPLKTDEEKILSIFATNFNKKVTSELLTAAEKKGLDKEQLIILASIVERETRDNEDRPIVAGIFIKRWRESLPLGSDVTVQYALGYSNDEKSWWRENLSAEDLDFSSPYNTRKNAGLPPGPICSPGLSAINAVINSVESPYYFFLLDKNGKTHYAKTYEEHLQNIKQYL
jgi:UPF0755 protein